MGWEKREDTPEDKKFRRLVRIRDRNTCQLCGTKRGKMDIHHIKRYADSIMLRTCVDNGILLCKKCHKSITGREFFYATLFHEIVASKKRK